MGFGVFGLIGIKVLAKDEQSYDYACDCYYGMTFRISNRYTLLYMIMAWFCARTVHDIFTLLFSYLLWVDICRYRMLKTVFHMIMSVQYFITNTNSLPEW